MDKLERRYLPIEELRVSNGDGGEPQIEWHASVFGLLSDDLGGFRERVHRRAFSKTLGENPDVRALMNHDANYVMGRTKSGTLNLAVDQKGLRAKVTLPDTQWARDLAVSIDRGDINAGSFGFYVVQDRWLQDDDGGIIRELVEVSLRNGDVSVVTYPAYPDTEGVALRSILGNLEWSDLIHPLLQARAGVLPTPEERGRFLAIITLLRSAVPEPDPPEDDEPDEEHDASPAAPALEVVHHSVAAATRRRQLRLVTHKLRLMGVE